MNGITTGSSNWTEYVIGEVIEKVEFKYINIYIPDKLPASIPLDDVPDAVSELFSELILDALEGEDLGRGLGRCDADKGEVWFSEERMF